MAKFGYTLMTEQSGPKALVDYAVKAEQVGFDFEVSSDHFSPWLVSQGHAPYAWTVLGAVAQATPRVELATYVTGPIQRYHPAVVDQKAATLIRELHSGELTTWEGGLLPDRLGPDLGRPRGWRAGCHHRVGSEVGRPVRAARRPPGRRRASLKPSSPTGRPVSPTSPSSRSATKASPSSWPKPPALADKLRAAAG